MIPSERVIAGCYGATLLTLPWAGLGVLRLLTGRDWGGGLQPSWVFMALAVVLTLGRSLMHGRWRLGRSPTKKIWSISEVRFGTLWAGAVVLSGIGLVIAAPPVALSEALIRFLKQIMQLAIMIVFVVWVARWTRGRRRWVWTARLVVIGALFQAGYGVLQLVDFGGHSAWFGALDRVFTSNPSILSGSGELYLDNAMQHVARLRGTACEPLYLGNYLLLAMPLVQLTGWKRVGRILAAFILFALLFLTWSRGAWLAGLGSLCVGMMVWARCAGQGSWRDRLRRNMGIRYLVLILVGVLVLAYLIPGTMDLPVRRLQQSLSTRDWSNLTRIYSLQAGWRAFLLSPLLGIGWGQFGWHFPVLVEPLGLQSQFSWPVVNNFFLEVLCETGLVGLATLLLWLGGGVRNCWRKLRPADRTDTWLCARSVAVAMAFTGVWLQLLTFSQYNLPHIWVALGLLFACAREAGPERPGVNS